MGKITIKGKTVEPGSSSYGIISWGAIISFLWMLRVILSAYNGGGWYWWPLIIFFIILLIAGTISEKVSYCEQCNDIFDFETNVCPVCNSPLTKIAIDELDSELVDTSGDFANETAYNENLEEFNSISSRDNGNTTKISEMQLEKPMLEGNPSHESVNATSAFGYKGAIIIYKVKIENNTAEPISDIKVYPYVPDVFLLKEKEKSISLIEPKSSQTVTFEIRPTGECGNCNVSGRVNYYDMASKKRQDIELEPKSLSIVCPMLHRKEISEDAWRDLVSNFVKAEETTTDISIEGEGLFGIISEILKDLNLFALAPNITKAQQIFRGSAKFYGEGIKGLRYAAQIEVVGGAKKSKLILKTWAEKEDALTGFYHGVLDEIEKRVKVKEYIDDSIAQNYNIHIGDEIGTQVKDSFVQRSNLGP